ncbi:MAG: citrate/2-methylcitrate synthase [Spirochaetaceae bacterium]|jgi:citrate synthase|nr:citrate/2-methylcitrate synthase [Spirochaetaceae bacterium]GMO21317.1 MAG: citrate/2-methylcitrate synthase [Termitinemataceae bacterium]
MGIHDYIASLEVCDSIDFELYNKYNVKRGLRNADGTGVLVGLTRVGEVHGYMTSEGEKVAVDGKLFYRGYDVEELVAGCVADGRYGFEETVYLLLFGELPSKIQLERFCELMGSVRGLPERFSEDSIMRQPSRDIMNKLARSVLTLYSYDENPEDRSPENVLKQCVELISRFPAIIAYAYRAKAHYFDNKSLIIHQNDSSLYTAESILSLMRRDRQFSRLEAEILDLMLILHAEHGGGNNSTFAVHLVTSADTDTYSAISAGIASLKGTKHGGANAKVMGMMAEIERNVEQWDDEVQVRDYLEKILKREAYDGSGLIYGMGHAVYTKSDPRALLLREKAADLIIEKPQFLPEYRLYRMVERLSPDLIRGIKKREKEICANVDFYSGLVYKMLDIPADLYTPLFAVSRVAGWCAHRLEELISGRRIIRPAYKCVQSHTPYTRLKTR